MNMRHETLKYMSLRGDSIEDIMFATSYTRGTTKCLISRLGVKYKGLRARKTRSLAIPPNLVDEYKKLARKLACEAGNAEYVASVILGV